jgi:two-component system cell cycle response regulator
MVTWQHLYLEGMMPMQHLLALVVDDSKVGRLTMMKKLEAIGLKVDLAESGQQAFDYLARQHPDMIFMDHMMPEMDGFEVTRRLKADPATREIPVIIISGNDEDSFVQEARAAGALDAIAKPPATEVLEALLASLPKSHAEAPKPEVAPAPAVDMAELQVLVERLLGTAISPLRNEFMVGIKLGVAATETLGKRLQSVEERLLPMEAETGRPQLDIHALQADMDQRIDQRITAGLAGQQTLIESLMPQLESLRQAIQTAQANAEQRAADTDQKAAGWNSRLDTFAADLMQVSLALESAQAAQVEYQQRIEQHIEERLEQSQARVQEAFSALQPVVASAPESVMEVTNAAISDATKAELQVLQTELVELREQLSEARLQQLVTATVASLPPAMAPVVTEAPPAMANESLQTELDQLRAKVKTLTVATAVGGALLLVAVGFAVFGG